MGLRSENYVYCSFVFSTSRGPMSPKSKSKAAFLKFIYSHKQNNKKKSKLTQNSHKQIKKVLINNDYFGGSDETRTRDL